jgi:isocitrate dehydrogenase (NAD+)
MTHRVAIIAGDGIGPEVTDAARRVLDASGASIDWVVADAGDDCLRRTGVALPEATLQVVRDCGVGLKGPTTTSRSGATRSVSLALRRALRLHTGIRPCRSFPGVPGAAPGVDLVVVRMNGEDLYEGIEYGAASEAAATVRELVRRSHRIELPADTGISLKPISQTGARQTLTTAFEYARSRRRSRVTAVHKATVMRETDGLFLQTAEEVARRHPDIEFDDLLVDTCCAELVRRPSARDVLVMPVLYGDVVSDLAAALVGGPGLAPGANVGDRCAVFEASHGSAPRHAGQDRANPLALVLSGAMMLDHLGEHDAAERLEAAVRGLLSEGSTVSYDLRPEGDARPPAGTSAVAAALVEELRSTRSG